MMAARIYWRLLAVAFAAALLGACASGMNDLEEWVSEVKSRPASGIEPLPEIEPYESFTYSAQQLRSPFAPGRQQTDVPVGEACPDPNRRAEPLESYSLDALAMVGTFTKDGQMWALVRDPEGIIHRVQQGNYLGRNDGQIVSITETEINVLEMVSNNRGGCIEREATLALNTE